LNKEANVSKTVKTWHRMCTLHNLRFTATYIGNVLSSLERQRKHW